MTEDRLDKLIGAAAESYRVPKEPDVNGMWAEVEAGLDAHRVDVPVRAPRRTSWGPLGMVAAAALVAGIGLGRWSVPEAATGAAGLASGEPPAANVQQVAYIPEPLQRTATSYFGETAALLKEVQANPRGTYAAQAMTLLSTTRLLLDSPAAGDEKLHELLEDLELILAQIATLNSNGSTAIQNEDLDMIRSALVDRDVVPRVHTAAVTIAAFDD
jgi:hypothetical protein